MAITVGGLFQNATFLYGMRLAAGDGGMDEPALWAHAVEDAISARGLRGGEVAFASGLAGTEGLLPLARALREKNASALIVTVGLGSRISALPPELVAFCANENMPLFTIPLETPISDMTRDFCHRIMRSENAERDAAALFQTLLFHPGDAGETVARLARRGFRPEGNYRFACVAAQTDGRALARAAEGAAREIRVPFLAFPHGDALVCVLMDWETGEVARFLRGMFARLPDPRPAVGVSPPREGIANQAANLTRAMCAMNVARARGERILYYEALGLYQILCAVEDAGVLRAFYERTAAPLEVHDRENGTEFLLLVEVYVASGGNLSRVAARWGVHRNTVANQLKKIRALTGLDPLDLNDALLFKTGLMARDLL